MSHRDSLPSVSVLWAWIEENALPIQAVATAVLVLVTAIYVLLTHRLLHATNDSHVEPISIRSKEMEWQIYVNNLGPGLARLVRVDKLVLKSFVLDPKPRPSDPPFKGFSEQSVIPAEGKVTLVPGDANWYTFGKHLLDAEGIFILSWETTSGKKHKSWWRFPTSKTGPRLPIEIKRGERATYYAKRARSRIKSPFIRLQKWWHVVTTKSDE